MINASIDYDQKRGTFFFRLRSGEEDREFAQFYPGEGDIYTREGAESILNQLSETDPDFIPAQLIRE